MATVLSEMALRWAVAEESPSTAKRQPARAGSRKGGQPHRNELLHEWNDAWEAAGNSAKQTADVSCSEDETVSPCWCKSVFDAEWNTLNTCSCLRESAQKTAYSLLLFSFLIKIYK